MITLNLSWAIGIYISFVLILVLSMWIFYNCSREEEPFQKSEFLVHCPYCTHLFFEYLDSDHLICPLCRSYLIKEKGTNRMGLKKLRNEQGVILVTVLMVTTLMMIFVIGIISINVGQVLTGQKQIDRIKSEAIAMAAQLRMLDKLNNADETPTTVTQSLDGKNFSATSTPAALNSGLDDTRSLSTVITY